MPLVATPASFEKSRPFPFFRAVQRHPAVNAVFFPAIPLQNVSFLPPFFSLHSLHSLTNCNLDSTQKQKIEKKRNNKLLYITP
mmetsp:Transcript_28284/g.72151  ORF Transcript_28284/g.72151 Transcript_28284/m.72151 type:complete len:83 (+) Transcript_28284:1576-1824(+)